MSRLHWLTAGRRALYAKLAERYLPFSASLALSDSDDFSESIVPGLKTEAMGPTGKADLLIVTGASSLSPLEIYNRCNPGGVVILDSLQMRGEEMQQRAEKLKNAGMEVELVLRYGFLTRLLALPVRWMGVKPDPERLPPAPVNALLRFVIRLELYLHPYLRFFTGDGTLLVATHLPVPPVTRRDLSIVIPAYNEEKRILPFLDSIRDYFQKRELSYEVIVVDDGSRDRTREVCDGYFPQVRAVRLYRNFGKGGAVREGVRLAEGERILISDADGSTPIHEVERLAIWLDRGRDLAIGSRYMERSQVVVKQNFFRRILSRSGNLLIRLLTGLSFKDTQCGFKLFHRIPAKVLFRNLKNHRFGFDFEILKKARQARFVVEEIPVEWHDVQGSKVRLKDTLGVLGELFSMQFGYLMRFSLAGVLNTTVEYSVKGALVFATAAVAVLSPGNLWVTTAYHAAGFLVANAVSFGVNSCFVFRARGTYGKFLLISLVTFTLSLLSYYGLDAIFNPGSDGAIGSFLKLSTVVISLYTNYFGYRLLVFDVD